MDIQSEFTFCVDVSGLEVMIVVFYVIAAYDLMAV